MKIVSQAFPLKALTFLLVLVFVSSCNKGYGPFVYTAPGSDRVVTITGEKFTPLAPVMVTIHVKVAKGEKPFTIELAAFSLSEENIEVIWESADKGKIIFTQTDNSTKVMNMQLSDELIHVIQDIKAPGDVLVIPH